MGSAKLFQHLLQIMKKKSRDILTVFLINDIFNTFSLKVISALEVLLMGVNQSRSCTTRLGM